MSQRLVSQTMNSFRSLIGALSSTLFFLAACSTGHPAAGRNPGGLSSGTPIATSPTAGQSEAAAPVESNPPGDIPDSQQFVRYTSAAGKYEFKSPEGWARTERDSSVTFVEKLNSVGVDLEAASEARTAASIRSIDEPKLSSSVRAFEEVKVEPVTLSAGPAMLLRYRANSNPDPVTNKVIRLEIDRYEVFSNGRLAIISLSAPAGSDNIDVWRIISRSFRWSA